MTRQIGFIGLGIMGGPMAMNLLKAGYRLVVNSRTKIKAQAVLDAGAVWADSAAQVAENNQIILICVPDTPDVEKVLLGSKGVITTARPGTICVDHSTISPKQTQIMARQLEQKQITLLDAPISGGQIGAIEAKLSIMVGGPADALEKVRPVLQTIGRNIVHCGSSGSGQMTKLANQIMVIHTVMSIAEGLAFAEKAGLNLQTTFDATSSGAASSASLKNLGPKIIAGDMKPAFMVDLQLKDLRLVLECAEEMKQPLPGVALAKQLLTVLQAQGRGGDGTQAMIDVIRGLGRKSTFHFNSGLF